MPTMEDFNNAVHQLADLALHLGIKVDSADFDEESRDDGEGDHDVRIVNIFFDHSQATPLTLDATGA